MKVEEVKMGDGIKERKIQIKNIGENVKAKEGFKGRRVHSDNTLTSTGPPHGSARLPLLFIVITSMKSALACLRSATNLQTVP